MNPRKFLVAACALGCWVLSAQTTTTTTSATRQISFPPAGLGATETARVNLVHTATTSSSSSTTAVACAVTVTFLSSSGATIGSATTLTLTSGAINSVSLPFASSGLGGARGEIRAEIQYTESSTNRCNLSYSYTTFDTSSGVTHLFLAGAGGLGGGPQR